MSIILVGCKKNYGIIVDHMFGHNLPSPSSRKPCASIEAISSANTCDEFGSSELSISAIISGWFRAN